MTRVKRGIIHTKKRHNILSKTKGFKWGRKNLIRLASTATTKAGAHSYTDRRKKKRNARALWQIRISAFAKDHNLSYSKMMNLLKKANVKLDRKNLADLAANHPDILSKILEQIQ